MPFEKKLCSDGPLALVDLGPHFGQAIHAGVTVENPGVLVERMTEEHGQACYQRNG